MSWAEEKFNQCVYGISSLEEDSPIFKEDGPWVEGDNPTFSWPDIPGPALSGIKPIAGDMGGNKNKNIGYFVERKMLPGGKFFIGVVQVPRGMRNEDFFNELDKLFGSQNDIHGISKPEAAQERRTSMIQKYDEQRMKCFLPECKERFMDTEEIKWWSMEELREVIDGTKKEKVIENPQVKLKKLEQTVVIKEDVIKTDSVIEATVNETVVAQTKVFSTSSPKKSSDNEGENGAEKIKELEKAIEEKEERITKLVKEVTDMEAEIKIEAAEMEKSMGQKDNQISLLCKEIKELESKGKKLLATINQLESDKHEWFQDVQEQDSINDLENAMKVKEDELEDVKKEKAEVEKKLSLLENEMVEKSRLLDHANSQMKIIRDNSSFLETELLKQKTDMDKEIESAKEKLEGKKGEVETLKNELAKLKNEAEGKMEELGTRDKEIENLRLKVKLLSGDGKFDKILELLQDTKSSRAEGNAERPASTNSSRDNQVSNNSSQDIQVSRVQNSGVKFLMFGHPEWFRNMEAIPSIKKVVHDLTNSKNLVTITADFEGFYMDKLVIEAEKMKKENLENDHENNALEITNIIIFPGNHYTAAALAEENKNKEKYRIETKLRLACDSLVNETIFLIDAVKGKNKEILVIIDPSNEKTYEFSKKFENALPKAIQDWKNSLNEQDVPNIKTWNLTEQQVSKGTYNPDKRNCIQIDETERVVWLDRSLFTADQMRVSKITTIATVNKIIDTVSKVPAPAAPCKTCGIQQSTSYVAKCIPSDMGEYKICESCLKDSHDATSCYSMQFKSERICRQKKCADAQLKHQPCVHDIMGKKYQEQAKKELNQDIDFWDKPRFKRPFFLLNNRSREAPYNKRQRRGR